MTARAALKNRGVTGVIVSHKANVFRSADKILYLKDGRMELFGPRDQVFARLAQPAPSIRPAPQPQQPPQAQPGAPAGGGGLIPELSIPGPSKAAAGR